MKTNRLKFQSLAIALVMAAGPLAAEVIILKNGRTINGKIVGQTRSVVRVATAGGTRTIAKGTVRRIIYGGKDPRQEKAEEERRKKQAQLRKKQEEEFRKRQEELLKQQQEDLLKKQEEDRRRQLEEQQRRQVEAQKRAEAVRRPPVSDSDSTLGGALWRSAILPGWGQSYQGRSVEGTAYMATFGALMGIGAMTYQNFWMHRTNYQRASETFLLTSTFVLDQTNQSLPSNGSFAENMSMIALADASGTRHGIENYLARGDSLATAMLFYEFRNSRLTTNDREKLFMLDALATSARERTNMQRAAYNLNLTATLLGSFYVWNLVDVAIFAPDSNSSISFSIVPGQYGFVYGTRF